MTNMSKGEMYVKIEIVKKVNIKGKQKRKLIYV